MKEDLIRYKQMLEEERLGGKKYYIVNSCDINKLCYYGGAIVSNYLSLCNFFNDSITISSVQNNSSIPIEERCEELIKKAIKYFSDNDIPFNCIELISDLFFLVDEDILKIWQEDKNEVGGLDGDDQISRARKLLHNYPRLISGYASKTYVYLRFALSTNSGIWGYEKNMAFGPMYSINEQSRNFPEELGKESICGIVNLEEFVRKMKERGYDIDIGFEYNIEPKSPTIEDYFTALYDQNRRNHTISLIANLEKMEHLTKKRTHN